MKNGLMKGVVDKRMNITLPRHVTGPFRVRKQLVNSVVQFCEHFPLLHYY
jgi:hypothetical protein